MTGAVKPGVYIVRCVQCGKPRRFVDVDDVADVCAECREKLRKKPKGDDD